MTEQLLTDEKIRRLEALLVELDKRIAQRFEDQQRALHTALAAAHKALEKVEINDDKWRTSVNDWRAVMVDRERTLMSRAEALASLTLNADKIDVLETRIDRSEGRTSGLLTIFSILGALGILVSIFLALRR